jgi:hypothetical protein
MSEEATQPASAPAAGSTPSTGAPAVSGEYVEAQLSETQHAALKEVASLRIEYGKTPSDALLHKMGKLQAFALGGGEKPADFMPGDPLPPDLSEHDPLAAAFGDGLARPMGADELAMFKSAGTIRGLHPSTSGAVAALVQDLAMPKVIANQILDRSVKHFGQEHDGDALTAAEAFAPLSPEQEREYREVACRVHPGGAPAFEGLSREVREMLKERGVLEALEKSGFMRSSLMFDARVLHALRLWCQTSAPRPRE